ncbi:MAG: phosphatase PAP2 family protein [Acidimicrobiales bacterium]
MQLGPVALAVLGAVVLGGAVAGAKHPTIRPAEQRAFRAVNGLPGWLYWPLWAPMQLGNLVVGTVVGLLVAWALGDRRVAVAVVAAMLLKLVAERWLRRALAPWMEVRQRPGASEPGAILRGADVPISGMSFPSGHVILVAAVAAVVTWGLPAELVWIPWLLAVLVAVGRVYVGAHNPLDVVAGLGMGMLVGGMLQLVLTALG